MNIGDCVRLKDEFVIGNLFTKQDCGILIGFADEYTSQIIWLDADCHRTLHWRTDKLESCEYPENIDWIHLATRFNYFVNSYLAFMRQK